MATTQQRRLILIAGVLAGLALLTLGALALVPRFDPLNNDFFKFWLAGRLVWEGGDPQAPADWVAGHARYGSTWLPERTSLYPLPLALLLVPLGLLPVSLAFAVLIALSAMLTLGAAALTMRLWPEAVWRPYLLPVMAAVMLYRPLLVTLWSGQLSALFLAALALAVWWWERGRWRAGGVALALLCLKPSLGVPLIAICLPWLLVQRRWAALGAIAGGLTGLLLLGMVHTPDWPLRFLSIGGERAADRLGTTPNLWGLGRVLCGGAPACTLTAGGALSLALLIGAAALLRRRLAALRAHQAIAWAAPLALLTTPYTYAYDQLILIVPLVTATMAFAASGAPFLKAALIPLGLSAIALVCSIPADRVGHDIASVGVPLASLALAAAVTRHNRTTSGEGPGRASPP